MNRYTVNGYTRISKNQARKLWTANTTPVFACPCKLRPGAPWYPEIQFPTDTGSTWEQLTNAAEYYKCGPAEGRRLVYYVAEEVLPL